MRWNKKAGLACLLLSLALLLGCAWLLLRRLRQEPDPLAAMLLACQVVLGNLLQVPLLGKQYNFGFVPIALAGALLAQYQSFADINMGRGAIVIGLAAVIIGEALMSRIARNFAVRLLSVIIGGIVYYVLYQVIIELGLDTDFLKMLTALLVAIFLGLPYVKKTYFPAKSMKESKKHA